MHFEIESLEPPSLDEAWQPWLQAFYAELLKANQQMNLTRVTDQAEFESKHLLDSLALLQVLPDTPGQKLLDLGTGGGVPGLPLWLVKPQWEVTLLDSVGKKIRAVQTMAEHLQAQFPNHLPQLPVCLQARAESLGHNRQHREQYDIVVSRAVATLPVLLEYALPLLKRRGLFVAMKGPSFQQEMQDISVIAGLLGGRLARICSYSLPPDLQRVLVIFEKRSHTPHAFPRKDSNLRKNPLSQRSKGALYEVKGKMS